MVEIIVCEIICWLINKIITSDLDGSGPLSGQDSATLKSKLHYAAHVISQRGEDILSSIPQGLGLVFAPGQHQYFEEPPQANVSGGYMLVWHLYTVGKSPVISNGDRKWVIERLKGISESAGIDMALELAQDLTNLEVNGK
jgi:hypothetical protein